jgi:putative endonuclease
MKQHNYYVYIVTNPARTVLYIGVSNDLIIRLQQHFDNRGKPETFAGKYHCYNLIYWERFQYIDHAIEREKELKKWRREKKDQLIDVFNPERKFLNTEIQED